MIEQNLPLFELFTRLRQADVPLGIDDYHLLLHALQAGFGIGDRDALAHLCKTLWIKSHEQERLFNYHFDQVLDQTVITENTGTIESVSDKIEHPPTSSISTAETPGPKPLPTPPSEIVINVESQAAQAVLHAAGEDELPYNRFVKSDEYFPVTRRQMKQSWRYLRRPIREGPPTELDVGATISEIGRTGILLNPVLVPPRKNRAELLLLIDQGGSMVPFHALSRRLAETASRGGRLVSISVYYFHNCPTTHLYRQPRHKDAESIPEILARPRDEHAGVLIISDAGAARRGFSQERLEITKQFLERFHRQFRYISWLNPVPVQRWTDTTAERIQQLVPMFDISRRGLDAAISLLRGRNIPLIHGQRYGHNE